MVRALHKLSARHVATLKADGRHSDGGGLYLAISGERRRWVFMYVRAGKQTELGLGAARDISLARARERAAECRLELSEGRDPRAARRPQTATFGDFADQYIDDKIAPSLRNPKHLAQWKMTLREYAGPLRPMALDRIATEDVLSVLKPLWSTKAETAARLRGRIESVLDAARAKGLRSGDNPARWRGHLDHLLPKRNQLSRGHHAALPFADMPAFLADLRGRDGMGALVLEFTILTAARSGEALGARWAEFDLEKAIWTVPPERMKSGVEHRVPLSKRALKIVQVRSEAAGGADLVFPGERSGRPLSNMAMATVLRRMKRDSITVHGFRSAFRDWAGELTAYPREICEAALAHTIESKVEAAYRRGDALEKRRELMAAWSAFCGSENS